MKTVIYLFYSSFLNLFISFTCYSQSSSEPETLLKKYLEEFTVSTNNGSLSFYSVAGLKQTNMYSFAVEKLNEESTRRETYKRILKKLALQSEFDVTNLFKIYNCKGGANSETLKNFYTDLTSYSGVLKAVLKFGETSKTYSQIGQYKTLITGVTRSDFKGMSNFVTVLSMIQNGSVVINEANYLHEYYLLLTAASFDIGLKRMLELKNLSCISDQSYIDALDETIIELQSFPAVFWVKMAKTFADNKDATFKGVASFFQVMNGGAQIYVQSLSATSAAAISASAFLGWSSAAVSVISTIKMIKDWNQEWRDITLLGTLYKNLTRNGYSSMYYLDIADFSQFLFLEKMAKCMENQKLGFWEFFKPDQKSVRLYVENDLGSITQAIVKKRIDSELSCDDSKVVSVKVDGNSTFTDPRDGHTYKTVKIGNQIWMAENLAYNYDFDNGNWIYDNNKNNLFKYGYLYSAGAADFSCPAGWHLPSKKEFESLLGNVGGEGTNAYNALIDGGESGFMANFGGFNNDYQNGTHKFFEIEKKAYYWASGAAHSYGWNLILDIISKSAKLERSYEGEGYSVRCVKDESNTRNISPNGSLINNIVFEDNFSDLSKWILWGDPPPGFISNFKGRTGIFDNNGDPSYNSGAISKDKFIFSKNLSIESDVYLDFWNMAGCWNSAAIGIANSTYQSWGGYDAYLVFSLFSVGNACWASPPNTFGHAYTSGYYLSDNGMIAFTSPNGNSDNQVNADAYKNKWSKLKVVIDASGVPNCYINDNLVFQGTVPLAASIRSTASPLWLGDRSSGSAGKAYHDNIKVFRK